jgi:hypothetical protein
MGIAMNKKQLIELLIEYAKSNLEYDQNHPNVGMGISVESAVRAAKESIKEEAARWDREVTIEPSYIKAVTKYLSETGGDRPWFDTWEGWMSKRWYVIKGQKAHHFSRAGDAMFGYWQVTRRTSKPRHYEYYTDYHSRRQDPTPKREEHETVYYADGSGYVNFGGPCGPLYFDRNGDT